MQNCHYLDIISFGIDLRVQSLKQRVRWYETFLKNEDGFGNPGQSTSTLKVSNIGLDRPTSSL